MFWSEALRGAGIWVILSLAASQLTEQEQSIIVEKHNELRSVVQPGAAFMQKLVWDEGLRLVAEAYASKCIWDHNPELESLGLGENLFTGTGPFNATKAVMDWFDEHQDYDYENDKCTEDKMCGHYTQMVWADSKKIGCASHLCDTLEGLDFKGATILVCDYHPHGNIEGQKPYEEGAPCSKCPEDLPVCDSHICVFENHFPPSEDPDDDTEHPTVLPEHPTVLPERPGTSTEPSILIHEFTHVIIDFSDMEKTMGSHGSKMEGLSAPLLMLVWLLAAFIL